MEGCRTGVCYKTGTMPRPYRWTWIAAAALCCSMGASASEEGGAPPGSAGTGAAVPTEAARPTGWVVQGLPLINFNTDSGVGYGAQVVAVDRADGTWRPWRASITLMYWATTADIFNHSLAVDFPRALGTKWRVGAEVQVSRHRFNPWYGLGNASAYDRTSDQCEDRAGLATNPDVCGTNPGFRGLRYYQYDLFGLPRLHLNLRRPLGDAWQLFLGYRLRLESVRLHYDAGELGQTQDSQLVQDALAGRVAGLDGTQPGLQSQRTSELTAGIQYDTREPEAVPSAGMFHELAVRGASRVLGSEFDYWGATLHARAWLPVGGPQTRLVAALRGLADVSGGEVPVTMLSRFGGLDSREGLGGTSSGRGILRNRYQGPVKVLATAELRWLPLEVHPLGQRFDFGGVCFADAGRVWSDLSFSEGGGLKASAGGGLRVVWNQVMVIRVDYGVGLTEPSTGFYLEMGSSF